MAASFGEDEAGLGWTQMGGMVEGGSEASRVETEVLSGISKAEEEKRQRQSWGLGVEGLLRSPKGEGRKE